LFINTNLQNRQPKELPDKNKYLVILITGYFFVLDNLNYPV